MLTEKQQQFIRDNKEIIFTTASATGQPRSIIVEATDVTSSRILVTDNYMNFSCENVYQNEQVFILAFSPDFSIVLKISAKAEYKNQGEEFDFLVGHESNKDVNPKGAVIIHIQDVVESSGE